MLLPSIVVSVTLRTAHSGILWRWLLSVVRILLFLCLYGILEGLRQYLLN